MDSNACRAGEVERNVNQTTIFRCAAGFAKRHCWVAQRANFRAMIVQPMVVPHVQSVTAMIARWQPDAEQLLGGLRHLGIERARLQTDAL